MSKKTNLDDPRLVECISVLEKLSMFAAEACVTVLGGRLSIIISNGDIEHPSFRAKIPNQKILNGKKFSSAKAHRFKNMSWVVRHANRASSALREGDLAGFALEYGNAILAATLDSSGAGMKAQLGAIMGGKRKNTDKRDKELYAEHQAAKASNPKMTYKQFAKKRGMNPDTLRKALDRAKEATKRKSGK